MNDGNYWLNYLLTLALIIGVGIGYFAFAYRWMYDYAIKLHPTKVFPPGNKLVLTNPNWHGNLAPQELTCVVLGDSSSSGQGADDQTGCYSYQFLRDHLLTKYSHIYIYNLGESGAKTADVLDRQVPLALNLAPDLIMIAMGGNDLIQSYDRRIFAQNYRSVLNQLQTLNKPIIVLNIPAFNCTPLLLEPMRTFLHWRAWYFNQALAQIAQEFPCVQLVDIYSIQDDGVKDSTIYFSDDRFHLSTLGYGLWSTQIAKDVKL
jgi:lysophospholipase L1-like esterase